MAKKQLVKYHPHGGGWNLAKGIARMGNKYIRKHGVVGAAKNAWNAGKAIAKTFKRKAGGEPTFKTTKKIKSGDRPKRKGGLPAMNTQWDLSTERWVKTFRKKRFRKSLGQAVVYHTWQKISTGLVGEQQCENLRAIMTADELKGTLPMTLNRDSIFEAVSNIWDTHPNRKITGSDVIPAQTPKEDQIIWRTTDIKLTCTSLENQGQEVMIFWASPKTSNREFPVQAWDRCVDISSLTVADALNPGYGTDVFTGSGKASTYGFDPRTNPAWRKLFKVHKVHKFFLAPGETHKIHCELRFNQLVNKAWTENLDLDAEILANHTITPFCIIRGVPCALSQTGADPAVVSMGYSSTKVGWVFTMKHFFSYCDSTRYNYQRVNLGIPIGVPKTEQRFIDDNEEPETYHDVESSVTHPH